MKSAVFIFFITLPVICSAGPRFPNPISPDEIWQNDRDLLNAVESVQAQISTSIISGSTSYIQNTTSLQSATFHVSSGSALNFNSSTVTVSNLATITNLISSSATITTLGVSSGVITNLSSSNGTISNLKVSTQTWQGFGILPILQIQIGKTTSNALTIATSFTDTNLSVSITPKLSTSKILVYAVGTVRQNAGDNGFVTISRGATNLSSDNNGFLGTTSNNNYFSSMIAYDSPLTTSATTYIVRQRTAGGGGSIEFVPSTAGTTNEAVILAVEIAN